MAKTPDILVIRHGETEWNRAGRLQGRLDSALTSLGRAQAEALGPLLASLGVAKGTHLILSSPQGRSLATASLALGPMGLATGIDERLAEVDVGQLSGQRMAEIEARGQGLLPDESYAEFCCRAPGGEGFESLWARAEAVLSDLSGPTVLFTHGLTSRFLRTIAMGYGPDQLQEVPDGQGVIFSVAGGIHTCHAPEDLHKSR